VKRRLLPLLPLREERAGERRAVFPGIAHSPLVPRGQREKISERGLA
jgi:hypothetical protein